MIDQETKHHSHLVDHILLKELLVEERADSLDCKSDRSILLSSINSGKYKIKLTTASSKEHYALMEALQILSQTAQSRDLHKSWKL